MFLSNAPWVNTGYGSQTRVNVPRLKALGHEVAVIAFWGLQGGMLDWRGIPVYPCLSHRYGQDAVAPHARHFEADIVISLMDVWVCAPDRYPGERLCPWFPIDHEPMPEAILRRASQSYLPIVMSRFGERMCQDVGLECRYVPHSVNTGLFRPRPQRLARTAVGLPQDRYIVGMVAANKGNPSRKAFNEQITAFAAFQRQHPDALLYLHTRTGQDAPDGVDLVRLLDELGLEIGEDVLFVDQYAYRMGCTDEHMAQLYAGFDVLMNVSMGEGFGIPILEAQACGTPVIVGDWTAMSELCFPGSYAVQRHDAFRFRTSLESYQWLARPEAITALLEEAYRNNVSPGLPGPARAYDADHIAAIRWRPLLAEIEERIHESA